MQTKIEHYMKNFGNPEEIHTKAFKPEPKQTDGQNRATGCNFGDSSWRLRWLFEMQMMHDLDL